MSSVVNASYESRDRINYFYHVGHGYPELNIATSKHRLMVSLFQHRKCYVFAKVLDADSLIGVRDVELRCYKRGCALFLSCLFINADSKKNFVTTVPIDAAHSVVDFPFYPDEGELMDVEFHFIHAISGELLKVTRCTPIDVRFVETLSAEYQELRSSQYTREQYAHQVQQFYCTPDESKSRMLLSRTRCTSLKLEPVRDEPQFDLFVREEE
ncbi:hypothetical protein QTV44_002572 [Vibrio vulnificus]|nr:hypothetical protein [Vibrio vulnificus]